MRSMVLVLLVMLTTAVGWAETPQPLVDFGFDNGLTNAGTLGGRGEVVTYAPGQDPTFDIGIFGADLDLTAASRNGGSEFTLSGGAVTYHNAALDDLKEFTIVLWARRNVAVSGGNARLAMKEGEWDLNGYGTDISLGLGDGDTKVWHRMSFQNVVVPEADWRFIAMVVAPKTVRAYIGTTRTVFQSDDGKLVSAQTGRIAITVPPAHGALVIGNLAGIRPFNGWIDRFRVFGTALDDAAVKAVFAGDIAAMKSQPRRLIYDMALPEGPAPPFTLPHSAIPFSSRWQKRTDALDVMRSFHATHCLWVYGTDAAIIRKLQQQGLFYQGTLNGLQRNDKTTTEISAAGDPTGRHEDLDGNKNTPSWMVTFRPKPYTGCCNSPAFRNIFFDAAKQLVDAGVDSIHVDDWAMNASWVTAAGVCFCDSCRVGFRDYLKQNCTAEELKKLGIDNIATFDYRQFLKSHGIPDAATYRRKFRELPLTPYFIDFQVQSMRRFYRDLRLRLDEWSPHKYIPLSANAGLERIGLDGYTYGADLFDFLDGEMYDRSFAGHLLAGKAAEALPLPQVASPIPRTLAGTRATLATMYALGQWQLVPWDIYMGSDATGIQPRYYGTREQYGAYYDLIHDHPELFDGYDPAAEVGVLFSIDERSSASLRDLCEHLAAEQVQFRLVLAGSKYARIALRKSDLKALRLLVPASSPDSLGAADRQTLHAVLAEHRLRIVTPGDLTAALRRYDSDSSSPLDVLRLEAPANIYAFLRVNRSRRSAVGQLVNWNFTTDGNASETYEHVTLTLLHPERWGSFGTITYYQPGAAPITVKPEFHHDSVRLTLPRLETWGIVKIQTTAPGAP